jgi:hypothetical protein
MPRLSDPIVIGNSVLCGMVGKLSAEKLISVGIRFTFHVVVDFAVAWLWFPTEVAINDVGIAISYTWRLCQGILMFLSSLIQVSLLDYSSVSRLVVMGIWQ